MSDTGLDELKTLFTRRGHGQKFFPGSLGLRPLSLEYLGVHGFRHSRFKAFVVFRVAAANLELQ